MMRMMINIGLSMRSRVFLAFYSFSFEITERIGLAIFLVKNEKGREQNFLHKSNNSKQLAF